MTGSAKTPDVLPPNALQAEQDLLGAILINPEALDRARDHVRVEDFFEGVHGQFFARVCQLRDAGEAMVSPH
jgi:replicative DNA helicase